MINDMNILKYISLLVLVSIFISCEQVIEINLNSANPKIVIEGSITDQPGPYTVKISRTTDYYNPGEIPVVTGATVFISDNLGNTDHFTEVSPGLYQSDSLSGVAGRTYLLKAVIGDVIFTASSTMPQAIEIDSLFALQDNNDIRRHANNLRCIFQDTPGVEDFCRFKVYRNNEAEPDYILYNGRLSDGNVIEYNRFRVDLESGDLVKVELLSIDQPTYEYYSTLSDVIASDPRGPVSTEIPANPVSNITGDALGYFGAFTVRSDSLVMP